MCGLEALRGRPPIYNRCIKKSNPPCRVSGRIGHLGT